YGVGLLCFIAGFVVPKMIGKQGAGKLVSMMAHGHLSGSSPVAQATGPYMIRLVLFEATTLCGFVAAFKTQSPVYILPFAVLGFLGSLLSPPSERFIKSLTE